MRERPPERLVAGVLEEIIERERRWMGEDDPLLALSEEELLGCLARWTSRVRRDGRETVYTHAVAAALVRYWRRHSPDA